TFNARTSTPPGGLMERPASPLLKRIYPWSRRYAWTLCGFDEAAPTRKRNTMWAPASGNPIFQRTSSASAKLRSDGRYTTRRKKGIERNNIVVARLNENTIIVVRGIPTTG